MERDNMAMEVFFVFMGRQLSYGSSYGRSLYS